MCSVRVLTRRDVLKGATALSATACLRGTGVSFAGEQNEEACDIATTRQLFLDNWIVERTNGLERTLHQPEKKGLIQEADGRPWQRGYVSWFARDQKGLFHMRYSFLWWDAANRASAAKFPAEQFRRLYGYAVSDDGIRWRKPLLGLVDGPSGFRPAPKSKWREGAFLEPTGFSKQNSFGYPIEMLLDVGQFGGVDDPDRRYLVKAGGLYFSPDVPDFLGDPQWREKLTPVPDGSTPRGGILGWDAKEGVWLATGQTSGWQGRRGRDIGRWTSEDLKSWSPQQVVLPVAADESRLHHDWVEYYHMSGYRVGDVWLGMLILFHTDRSDPLWGHPTIKNVWMKGTTDTRLMMSRDAGRSWQRVAGKQVWIPHHEREDGYDRTLYPGRSMRVGDELWLYYYAVDGDHMGWRADNTTYYQDRMPITRTARAVIRFDGYVSLQAGGVVGSMTTKPLHTSGRKLAINAAAKGGHVRVEVRDASGKRLPGYALADCVPLEGDGISQSVRWRSHDQLPPADERPIRLHIELKKANLYGFQALA